MPEITNEDRYSASGSVIPVATWLRRIQRVAWPSFAQAWGPAFWGREKLLNSLRNAQRAGGVIRVDGLPRLGKSSLVAEGLRQALAEPVLHAVRVDLRTCWSKESLQGALGAGIAHLGNELGVVVGGERVAIEDFVALEDALERQGARGALWVEDLPLLAGAQSRNRRQEDWSWLPAAARQLRRLSVILTTAPGTAFRHWLAQVGDWPEAAPVIEVGTLHWEDMDPLQDRWEERWGEGLSFGARLQIWECTAGHPFYLVALLKTLFQQREPPDEEDSVRRQWALTVEQYRFLIDRQLAGLQGNQLQLLNALARAPEDKLYSKAFQHRSGLSPEQIQRAASSDRLAEWLSRDAAGRWTVLDPLLRVLVSDTK